MSVSQSPAGVTVDQLPTDEPLGLPRQDREASDATIEALDWDRPDHLFHLPLDTLHERRVESGMSWRTLCGQMRPPARRSRLSFGGLVDSCPRCDELDIP